MLTEFMKNKTFFKLNIYYSLNYNISLKFISYDSQNASKYFYPVLK